MKFKILSTGGCCFLVFALVLGGILVGQQRRGGGGEGGFPQPAPEREVTVTAIPGVIAAGAKCKLVWQGPDNADGIVGTKDGGLLFAQEQPRTVGLLHPKDKFSIFVTHTHGSRPLGSHYKA